MSQDQFYTFYEYTRHLDSNLSASMEDYLEMIYRMQLENPVIRVNMLAEWLHVQPSSVSKMVQKLSDAGFLHFERYGYITLLAKGMEYGEALLRRHEVIEQFLGLIQLPEDLILQETEKLEHMVSPATLAHISVFILFLKQNPAVLRQFYKYREQMEESGTP